MAGRFDVYHYTLTQLSTGRVFIHAQGFTSEAEFRRELDRWNRAMPDRSMSGSHDLLSDPLAGFGLLPQLMSLQLLLTACGAPHASEEAVERLHLGAL